MIRHKLLFGVVLFVALALINLSFSPKVTVPPSPTILIQPLPSITPAQIENLSLRLQHHLPNVQVVSAKQMPAMAYYEPRHRFKADSLLIWLNKPGMNKNFILGVTSKDISSDTPDWGIMGLADKPGHAAVVSTYRLNKQADKLPEQFYKVAIHELGHTQGLPHCNVNYCLMRDANGKNTTDEETDFCLSCKLYLKKKGWRFN